MAALIVDYLTHMGWTHASWPLGPDIQNFIEWKFVIFDFKFHWSSPIENKLLLMQEMSLQTVT